MKFILTIDLDGAAFDEEGELARILHKVGDKADNSGWQVGLDRKIRDSNGNTIGTWKFTD